MTSERVREIFSGLASPDREAFFRHVDDNVDWTVMGTHPLAGRYHGKKEFLAHTFQCLNRIVRAPAPMQIVHVIASGDWAAVELAMNAIGKNGMAYNNRYCWICRFTGEKIVEVRAYLDSALVQQLIDQNEAG